jgi:hypothetical protein
MRDRTEPGAIRSAGSRSRLTYGLAVALALAGSVAQAQSQADIASRENEEGKALMFADPPKYAEASAKFQDAVARVPEAKYFFNLCTSRYQEGKYGEALTACNAVSKNTTDDKLIAKAAKLTDRIKEVAKQQGLDLQPAGGGASPGDTPPGPGGETPNPNPATNPTNPPPNGNPPPPNGTGAPAGYAVGRPPEQGLYQAAPPEHHYTWTLGVDLYGGGGQIGQSGFYGKAAGGIRVKADYLLNPARKLGMQAYLQVTHFGADSMQTAAGSAVDTLEVFDLGLAGYKHLCLRGVQRLCLTPLAGLQLALMGPGSQQTDSTSTATDYAALGLRVQMSADLALGSKYEHVLSAMVGVNAYTGVFAAPSPDSCPSVFATCSAAVVGLDKGGAFAYIGVGYTYRFDTPFGQAPFVTLE